CARVVDLALGLNRFDVW
nr:immunoglobulin heavy chain junction region [Macaca mulatta]